MPDLDINTVLASAKAALARRKETGVFPSSVNFGVLTIWLNTLVESMTELQKALNTAETRMNTLQEELIKAKEPIPVNLVIAGTEVPLVLVSEVINETREIKASTPEQSVREDVEGQEGSEAPVSST